MYHLIRNDIETQCFARKVKCYIHLFTILITETHERTFKCSPIKSTKFKKKKQKISEETQRIFIYIYKKKRETSIAGYQPNRESSAL